MIKISRRLRKISYLSIHIILSKSYISSLYIVAVNIRKIPELIGCFNAIIPYKEKKAEPNPIKVRL